MNRSVIEATDRFTQPPRTGLLDRGRAAHRAISDRFLDRFLEVATAAGLWSAGVAMLAYDSANGTVSLWSAWASLVIGAAAVVTVVSWTWRQVTVTDRQRIKTINRGLDVLERERGLRD